MAPTNSESSPLGKPSPSRSKSANVENVDEETPQNELADLANTKSDTHPYTSVPDRHHLHAHFDCFSGAAGDMMLAACLDSVPVQADRDDLLSNIIRCINQGLPPLAGEFDIQLRRVWRGSGSIAALHVRVESIYQHVAAPVPKRAKKHNQHSNIRDGEKTTNDTSTHDHSCDNHAHDHECAHDHSHQHIHDHSHQHVHDHDHEYEHDRDHHDSHASSSLAQGHNHSHLHSRHSNSNQLIHPAIGSLGEEKARDDRSRLEVEKDDHHDHSHDHHNAHSYLHNHSHSDRGPLRNLTEIRQMLLDADKQYIPTWVSETAIQTFTHLAYAEMAVHGAESIHTVHFHEVGAVDSIVDIVGTLFVLHSIGVKTFSCSPVPLGRGQVRTDHGVLPVPAPATLYLIRGMMTTPGPPGMTGELVTPTAAALLKTLTEQSLERLGLDYGRAPPFTLRRVGTGAGTKNFDHHPNILRLLLGDNVVLQKR